MQPSLSDLELKVMAIIWRNGGQASAKQIFTEMNGEFGYTRGAVYALIHRCIEKRAIEREEPGFICRSIKDIQKDLVTYHLALRILTLTHEKKRWARLNS